MKTISILILLITPIPVYAWNDAGACLEQFNHCEPAGVIVILAPGEYNPDSPLVLGPFPAWAGSVEVRMAGVTFFVKPGASYGIELRGDGFGSKGVATFLLSGPFTMFERRKD